MRIIGVPFNSAGRLDAEAEAPQALRDAGLVPRLITALGSREPVRDCGDLAVGRPTSERDPRSGLRAVPELGTVTSAIRRAVAEAIREGDRPLVLGGDCAVLPGCLRGAEDALGVGAVGLLFVDGHEDGWPPQSSANGEAADCELGLILGRNHDQLPPSLRAEMPVLDPRSVVALGPRDGDEIAENGVPSLCGTITLVPADRLTSDGDAPVRHSAAAVDHVRATVDHWWLHVDLDVLATEALPAVDYPQPGGLNWSQLDAVVRSAVRRPGWVGTTVCIYDPDLDPEGVHAGRIVEHLADVFADGAPAAGRERGA